MRILHFAETLIGGPATHLNQLLPFQVEAYESVSVFCPERHANLVKIPGVRVIPFPDTDRSLKGLTALYHHWHQHLAQNNYDIIHLHSSFAGLVGRMARPRGTPIVYCARGWSFGMDVPSYQKRLYALVEKLFATQTNAIINISANEAEISNRAGIPSEKCHTIYNGIEDADWTPLPDNRRVKNLLFVGRYDRQKGIDHLVDAMATLSADGFTLTTIGGAVIGNPSIRNFPDTINDLGWLPSENVRQAMNEADAVIIPSRWEGFGFVAAEAMRAGRPVIASRVGGLAEIVIDGETGVLIEPDSANAIIDGVRHLASMNASLLGRNGRLRFESHFTAQRMYQQIDGIYRELEAPNHAP